MLTESVATETATDTPIEGPKKRVRKSKTAKAKADVMSIEDAERYVRALATYGFSFTVEQVQGWTVENVEDLRFKLNAWDVWRPGEDRAEVPQWLLQWENPTAEALDEAKAVGHEWRRMNPDDKAIDHNPWPAGTKLAEAWIDGVTNGPPASEVVETQQSEQATAETADVANVEQVAVSDPPIDDKVRVEQDARIKLLLDEIEQLRAKQSASGYVVSAREKDALEVGYKLARLTPTVNSSEQDYLASKKVADEKKATWQGLLKRLAEMSTELTEALGDGEYQQRLFREPYEGDSYEVTSDQVAAKSQPETAVPTPIEPPVDTGGEMDLESLKRKKLQELTGCDAEWGLTARQVENLKDAVGGATIKHLEKFQRETFNWEQNIPGFGEKAIDKLQDAHLAFRMKFDVPDPTAAYPEKEPEPTETPVAAPPAEIVDQTPVVAEPDSQQEADLVDENKSESAEESIGETLEVPDVNPEA